MSKKLLISIIVLAAVVLIFVVTRKPAPQEVKQTSAWSIPPTAAIDTVVLERKGKTIAFGKIDGQWTMTAPVVSKAAVKALADVEAVFEAGIKSDLIIESPDESYGFDDALHVEIKRGEDSVASFALGKQVTVPNSQAQRVWVKPDGGDEAYRAYSPAKVTDLGAALDRELDDWREKKVLGLKKEKILAIEIKREGSNITMTRGEDMDSWSLTQPMGIDIDVGRASSLVTTAENLLVDGFADGLTPEDAGLTSPARVVTFKNTDGDVIVEFGGLVDPKFPELAHGDATARFMRVMGSDLIYVIGGYKFDTLTSSLSELRDKKVLELDKDSISRIDFDGEQGFSLTRTGEQWMLTEGEVSQVADPAKIAPLLANLSQIRAINYIDDATLNPILDGKPNFLVVSFGQEKQHTLRFGASSQEAGNTVLAQLDNGLIFELSSFVATALRKTAADVRTE